MRQVLWLIGLSITALATSAYSQHPAGNPVAAVAIEGLGSVRHPVSTKSADAQRFFDQGLRLIYAFNHDEAHRAFAKAALVDPDLAMAHWGMALAVGPNYNLDAEEAQLKAAHASIQTAIKLAEKAPEHERCYILALAKRYAADPKTSDKKARALAYKNAMGELSKKYPDDLDAATLYAESAMNLRPWELWSRDGKPAAGTEEILAVLEGVLNRNPDHTGANHYYIHAIEASPWPERGLGAAQRLGTLAPGAGHLVHMPAHIYQRVGDYEQAALANARAAAIDEAYIKRFDIQGVYPLMYFSHNLHFLSVARAMQGRAFDALKAAEQLEAHIKPYIAAMPMLEFFYPTHILMLVRFGRWDEVFALPRPEEKMALTTALWHFARGSAFAARQDEPQLVKEIEALMKVAQAFPADAPYSDRNKAVEVLKIPTHVLRARLAVLHKMPDQAIAELRQACVIEDALGYTEPYDWYLPVRETLGSMLLAQGKAPEAEKTFREELLKNRRSGRALFGLVEALRAQKKDAAADLVRQEFESAWRNAEGKIRVEDY